MEQKTIKAADNPDLVNKLVKEASKEEKKTEKALIVSPPEGIVTLPGGYVTTEGEVITEVQVRELTGRDEEHIAKFSTAGKVLTAILNRGTVKVGHLDVNDQILDNMLAGDRDAVLLGIYGATFGTEADMDAYCSGCEEYKTLTLDINQDVEVKKLNDPILDRKFTVKGRKDEYTLVLPNGKLQKELLANPDRSLAELTTVLLEGTVREINGTPVLTRSDVQNIGVADRRTIAAELNKRAFGPILEKVEADCPDCGGKVVAPINLGTLFRF